MEITAEQKSDDRLSRLDTSILPFPEKYFNSEYLSLGAGAAALVICLVEIMAPSGAMEVGLDFALAALVFGVMTIRREKSWGRRPLAGLIMAGLTFIFFCFCFSVYHPGAANYIKRSPLDGYPKRTLGAAVDNFMGDPKWEVGQPADSEFFGFSLVNVRGHLTFNGQREKAVLQYLFNNETREFEVTAMEVAGRPLSDYDLMIVLDKIMESK